MKWMILFFVAQTMVTFGEGLMFTIPNQLDHEWPGELVSFDLEGQELPAGDLVLEVQGVVRPAQVMDGKVWSYVSISGKDDEGKKVEISTIPAHLRKGGIAPGIVLKEEGDFFIIDNGAYQFRLRNYGGKMEGPMALADFPHWCGGMRTKGQKGWDGKAYFESNAIVTAARTELVASGPVFLDFKITYEFEGDVDGLVEAMPLALGKQSHRFKPNVLPREMIPRRENHYELLIRFVMDDIWIDVNERFHFPQDKDASPFGISHYYLEWGEGGLPVDTVSWVRWFEYDSFGGNTSQQYVPAEPRPAQKGRPFALLRPRWNQGGGGAQDFVLTSGGGPPGRKSEAGKGYSPDNPAVGVVAAYASKWVGPYVNYIPVYAYDGNRGRARFPMVDGERSEMHYGQRAWGLLVGPRSRTADLNSVVRRHTDWTLTAQINKYILEWRRDPAKAGPNILVTQDQLKKLQADFREGRKTPVNAGLEAKAAEWKPLLDEREEILSGFAKTSAELEKRIARLKLATAERDAPKDLRAQLKELERERKSNRDALKKNSRLREIGKELGGVDYELFQLITTGESGERKMPGSDLWRGRRYQDDFLNPTSSPTRRIPDFAVADLFAGGVPQGGASQAAMGYIATDLDAWPGYHHGWRPGNPNFHTDKYMAAIFVGGAMLDHPHSKEWLDFGLQNFKEDTAKVFLEPDGVGAECPGYAGYAMKLQMEIARILMNTGAGNLMAGNPLVKKSGIWHRKLITPYDRRIQRRHEAPIGDTHRWDSGMYLEGFAKLASFFKETDLEFAKEMMGTAKLLRESKVAASKDAPEVDLKELVVSIDGSIPATPADEMDWSSATFEGFGAVMRDGFGTKGESFVSYKAGEARGHYHNDENSFHFYAGGTPIALDYNCSYTPRGDHAALHNSVTFGRSSDLTHNGNGQKIEAQEELTTTAKVIDFITTDFADLIETERSGDQLVMRPVDPKDHEFGRAYPTRKVSTLTHRRTLVFVKNGESSRLGDYLVVRDEMKGAETSQMNLHLLAREVQIAGDVITASGQMDQDMKVVFSGGRPEVRSWHYSDAWMSGPTEYVLRKGESQSEWQSRMEAMMEKHGVKSLPLPGWKPSWNNPDSEVSRSWQKLILETNGAALMQPPYWDESWMYGEYQKWVRINHEAESSLIWVLYPFRKGSEAPEITITDGLVRVALGDEVDTVAMNRETGVSIRRGDLISILGD